MLRLKISHSFMTLNKKDLGHIKEDLDEISIMIKERVDDKKSKEGNKK